MHEASCKKAGSPSGNPETVYLNGSHFSEKGISSFGNKSMVNIEGILP